MKGDDDEAAEPEHPTHSLDIGRPRPPGEDGQQEGARQTVETPAPKYDPAQELQVRKTVLRLLATHLRPPPNTSAKDAQERLPSDETFRPGISLDLTGATLVELNFNKVVVRATFNGATFTGTAHFNGRPSPATPGSTV